MNLKSFFILLLLSTGLVTTVRAQINLVPNGSFEEHSQCPDNNSMVSYATGWWGVNNSPDYFNACATWASFSVPDNFVGGQMAFDGNAYCGIIPFDFSANYREVIACELLDSVYIGKTYFLSMRVSRANGVTFTAASSNLGMRFSNTVYTASNTIPIDNFAHVYEDTVVTDSVNWVHLSWTFTPATSFKYLYIGNFFDDAHTDTVQLGSTPNRTYYYIDSVEVICQDPDCLSSTNQYGVKPIQIAYNADAKAINTNGAFAANDWIVIYDAAGKSVLHQKARSTIDVSGLPTGVYLVTILGDRLAIHHKVFIY